MQYLNSIIGLQKSNTSRISIAPCTTEGNLNTTGKILNNLYADFSSVENLILKGFNTTPEQSLTASSEITEIVGEEIIWQVLGHNLQNKEVANVDKFLKHHKPGGKYLFLYMFSEADNKWYVSRSDDQEFKPLDEELAKL